MKNLSVRLGATSDYQAVAQLYRETALTEGGIARTTSEITNEYIQQWMSKSLQSGLWCVVTDEDKNIVGSLHAYRPEPKVFHHCLSELTLAISPTAQGQGVGKLLLAYFLKTVETTMPDILRVELMVRESNERAQKLYRSLGFKNDGRMEMRISSVGGGYEADLSMAWLRT